MGKKIRVIVLVLILAVLTLCFVPNPLSYAMAADGGTIIYTTIIPVFHVTDWNHFELGGHSSENADSGYKSSTTTIGKQIYCFGTCIYDGRQTIPGHHSRSERKKLSR